SGEMGQVQKPDKAILPLYVKSILCTLLFINVCLLILLFLFPSLSSTISSSLKVWSTGTNVVYETEEIPYVMYFPIDTPKDEIEQS
ncbi:hypothetical protein R0J90_18790, partial [Micrococcus sp. SIMBA_144]